MNGNKANAHVDTFNELPITVQLGAFRHIVKVVASFADATQSTSTAVSTVSGRGSFVFIGYKHCRVSFG